MDVATLVRPAGIDGVEALSARFETHRYPRHLHDEWTLVLLDAGAAAFRPGRGERPAAAGDVVVIPPGEVHAGAPASAAGYAYRALYVAPEVLGLAAAARHLGRAPVLARAVARAHAAAAAAPGLVRDVELAAGLAAVHDALASRAVPQRAGAPRPAVARAAEAIDADPAADVPLAALAAHAGTSARSLVRGFARDLGLPPHAYRQARRVARARTLIAGGMPLAEVALASGFCDQAHLTRVFRAVTGVTPGRAPRP